MIGKSGWIAKDLVISFKELCNEPFYASVSKWLKAKEVNSPKESKQHFKPTVNPRSQLLDEQHKEKYMKDLGERLEQTSSNDTVWELDEVPDELDYKSTTQFKKLNESSSIVIKYKD